MQLLWGINYHLLTSYADPLKPGGNPKDIMDGSRDTEKGGGEWGKKKKVLEYEPLPLSRGVCGAFMSWQLIVSVGFLNGELRRIVSWLFKRAVGQKEKSAWLWRRLTRKAAFETFHFSPQTQALCGDPHTLTDVTISKSQRSAKTEPLLK